LSKYNKIKNKVFDLEAASKQDN